MQKKYAHAHTHTNEHNSIVHMLAHIQAGRTHAKDTPTKNSHSHKFD